MSAAAENGALLGGKYRVLRKLGEGGMGEVVLARHAELDQLVAIKLLRSDVAAAPAALQRFLREARAVARIESENVVRVFDVGRFDDGNAYMVMEYLEGEDLAQRLTRGPLPVEEAVGYVLQACVAIAEAHRVGVIHRDLKPSNLFLARRRDGSSMVKVVDFGISKLMSRGDRAELALTSDLLLGTPYYMAPEQLAADGQTDARTDVWALGMILFELLTGEGPFEADNLPQLCTRIMHATARRISQLRPEAHFPPGLEDVIDLCLAKDPKSRFADAVDLAVALTPFAIPGANSPIASELPTKPPPSWELAMPSLQATEVGMGPRPAPAPVARAGRRPTWASAAVVAGLVAVGAVVVFLATQPAPTSVHSAATARAAKQAPTTKHATARWRVVGSAVAAAPQPPAPTITLAPAPAARPAPSAAPPLSGDEFGGRK
jgi:serine/threonine-protein kinase